MSEDTPVTRKELREFGEELRAGFDTLAEVMRPVAEAAAVPHAGLVQQMTMSAPPPQRAERLVVAMAVIVTVMAFLAGGSIVAAILQGQRVTDLRADMHAERASREAFDHWNAQEVTAIRAYIATGRLQPMQSRPQPETTP